MGGKIPNFLKDQVIEIDRNVYIDPHDPAYFEKMLKYMRGNDPEMHFRLAKDWEQKGRFAKALFHYFEVTRYRSSYYEEARQALRRFDKESLEKYPVYKLPSKKRIPMWVRTVLVTFFLFLLFLIGAFLTDILAYI
ncbi:hypothetical protein [Ammoniphilus sp. YIM 78166]|uniref:hypothetical protein n=1 Tax=Ammoniphilus sp. YIM 78166 TaxID=1644106 RepID=UPI00106F4F3B|nr:hypothetical protein [Ammoniphilus sp. YIM 78166]